MATASSAEDRLVCPVCLCQFDRPRSLPCLHTFCTECLRAHIEMNAQRSVALTFACPVCRADTKPPRPFTTRDRWMEQFPVNYWILSAIEDMESRGRESFMFCDHHPDMKITLFCNDHARLCCPMCVATGHRKCDDVVDVDNVVMSGDLAREKEALVVEITQLHEHISKVAQQANVTQETLESKRINLERDVRISVDSAVDHIKTAEAKLLAEIGDFCSDTEAKINDKRTFCNKGASICEEVSEMLNDIDVKEANRADMIKLLKAKEKLFGNILNFGRFVDDTDVSVIDQMHVELNEEFRKTQHVNIIGKLVAECEENIHDAENDRTDTSIASTSHESENTSCPDRDELFESEQDYQRPDTISSGRISEDSRFRFVHMIHTATAPSGMSWITSAVSMKHRSFVLCDHKSSSVKLVKDGASMFEIKGETPWGVASLSNTQVAVSYPTNRYIQTYDVKCDATSVKVRILRKLPFLAQPLRPNQRFPTNDPCFGICFTGNMVVAACEDCIQSYTSTGRPIQSIETYARDCRFRRAICVAYCSTKETLYVCDEIGNSVVALRVAALNISTPARFVYIHPALRCPQGVATEPGGKVFVTGFVSRNIHVLSAEGESLWILDTREQPWAVCVDARRLRLLLSHYPGQGNSGACSVYDIVA